jgi:hypothetical protein
MINDYLQLVNIGGACYFEAKAEGARRRIAARREAAERAAALPPGDLETV